MKQAQTAEHPFHFPQNIQSFILSPAAVAKRLCYIILLLLLFHSIGLLFEGVIGHQSSFIGVMIRYFDFNGEENVPAFFSSFILLLASGLLYLIYLFSSRIKAKNGKKYWLCLAFIFAFMALDENIQIHEHIAEIVRPKLNSDLNGLLHWAWVLPYSAVLLCILVFFSKWVFSLPSNIRILFILSGGIYVLGALGFEFVEGYLYKSYGVNHIYNKLLYTLEELLEMAAIVLFVYTLLQYLTILKCNLLFSEKEI